MRIPSPDERVLELRSVTKAYDSRPPVSALHGIDLTIGSGELVAIVGPSGSGKTTLLHLMGTLNQPSGGSALTDLPVSPGAM